MRLRDYQIGAISELFRVFGVDPIEPEPDDDSIATDCGGDGFGQNGDDGGRRRAMANGSGDAGESPVRIEPAGNRYLFEDFA